jgi:TonB family protein
LAQLALSLTPPFRPWRPWVAGVSSVLGHGVLVGLFVLVSTLTRTEPLPRPKVRPVAMRALDPKQWARNRGQPEPLPTGQIVDVPEGNHRVARDATFLAESDNAVKKQTRARDTRSRYSVAAAKTTDRPEAQVAAQGKKSEAAGVTIASQLEHFTGLGGMRPKSFSELLRHESSGEGGERSADGTQRSNSDTTGEAVGGAAPNDSLDGVDEGEETALNTREFKYAAFFNRLKQAVGAKWDPNGRIRKKDPTGRITGWRDRSTVLFVALRPDGSIADLFVQQSSGLDELDTEAMQAFERAQPFTNPPAGLVKDGFIRFVFTFTLSNETPGFRAWPMPGR